MTDVLRAGTPEEAGLNPGRIELVRKRCQEWIDDGTHSALSVLVARRGVIALHESFGRMGPEPDALPIESDAIYPMASISKVIVGAVLMTLVDDGVIGLTRPVQEYIPEFTGDGKENVCVHHLLTHTSGIRDEDVLPLMWERVGNVEIPPKESTAHPWVHGYLWLGYDAPLSTPPGQEMAYCTYNIDLAGEIIRRVSGCRFSDVCHTQIFDPLGMKDTFYVLPDELFPRAVRRAPHPVLPGSFPTDSRENRRLPMPSTGVFSTASDMAVLVQTFLQGGTYGARRILSEHATAEMTRNQIPGISTDFFGEHHAEASVGYTWVVGSGEKWLHFPTFPRQSFNHMGGSGNIIWGDPDEDIVGVFLSVPTRYLAPVPPSILSEPIFNADLFANAVYAAVE
jgi:serine-type D-Ala-D-Ala carboxypeptidase